MLSALRSRPRQLSLFDETPFWDQASLEAAILRETGREVRLTLTDNRSGCTACSSTRPSAW